MERLTNDKGELIKCPGKTCGSVCERTTFCCECPIGEAFDRLAAYEAIGLTPDQIREVDRMYLEKCQEVNRYKRMAEIYEEHLKEGEKYGLGRKGFKEAADTEES